MDDNLFNHDDIDKANTHFPTEDTAAYDAKLDQVGKMDWTVLGVGTNGHIAFNEPGTPFGSKTHCIELDQKTREDNARFFNSIDEVPTHAITMGLANIMKAKKIILIAIGAQKAEALRKMILGDVTEEMPASILQFHPDVVILTDREAVKTLIK